ncbi:MAG: hypothetical protein VXZ72_02395, partial [Chlamydiota bacterium]|nr:hypothetical protein [Chlamydiota bacterium]
RTPRSAMNLLPTLFILLMVMGITTMRTFSALPTSDYELTLASFQLANTIRNERMEKLYKQQTRKYPNHREEPPKESSKKKTVYSYFREAPQCPQGGRIRISCLIEGDCPFLQSILNRYFDRLYGHLPGYQENLAHAIIDSLKEAPSDTTLYELTLPPSLSPLYYRILRGTHHYDINNRVGIPPLEEILSLTKTHSPPIAFPAAPLPLLEALFSPDCTKNIVTKERSRQSTDGLKRPSLSPGDLREILQKSSLQQIDQRMELCDFGRGSGQTLHRLIDEKTHLTRTTKPLKKESKGQKKSPDNP